MYTSMYKQLTVNKTKSCYCVDSHIKRIVLATEETTVTLQYHEEHLYLQPMIPPPSGFRPNVTN